MLPIDWWWWPGIGATLWDHSPEESHLGQILATRLQFDVPTAIQDTITFGPAADRVVAIRETPCCRMVRQVESENRLVLVYRHSLV